MNKFRFDGFDWDGCNIVKCQKHGVLIGELENLFFCAPLIGPDPNIETEERFGATGRNENDHYIFAVFTFRKIEGRRLIRPISARYMHAQEVSHYEKIR